MLLHPSAAAELTTLAPTLLASLSDGTGPPPTLRELAIMSGRGACLAVLDEALALAVPKGGLVMLRDGPLGRTVDVPESDAYLHAWRVLASTSASAPWSDVLVSPRGIPQIRKTVSPLLLQRIVCTHLPSCGVQKWGVYKCGFCLQDITDPGTV